MPALSTAQVAASDAVGPGATLLQIAGDFAAGPGQFYLLRAWDRYPLLSRPMAVFDRTPDGISFLVFARGEGTRRLSSLRPGAELTLFGPLGTPVARHGHKIALVGGGSGIAPLYLMAKEFRAAGPVHAFLGFREAPLLVSRFSEVAARVEVASEAGLGARQGLVTDVFRPDGYDACYACGPDGMLRAAWAACRRAEVPLQVLLEERMACGVGACRGCAVATPSGYRLVCKDGPAFAAPEVLGDG
jgi:dihydroorotate dehydrogenase electron transfer subunit